jgi:hypothetical protein
VKFTPIIGVVLTLWVSPASAHCYSVWRYPYPQHCGGVYTRTTAVRHAVAHPVEVRYDIPLPDMSATWGGAIDSELELSLQRQKAIRQLTQGE